MSKTKELAKSNYYCVISTNKTKSGRFITAVVRIKDFILPFNRYDKEKEMYYDYFHDREKALTFAALLKGTNNAAV